MAKITVTIYSHVFLNGTEPNYYYCLVKCHKKKKKISQYIRVFCGYIRVFRGGFKWVGFYFILFCFVVLYFCIFLSPMMHESWKCLTLIS